jgi:hypothetical protein
MKLTKFASLLVGLLMVIGSLGCAGKQRLNQVRLNMSKLEVAKTMGWEGQAKASETTADGKLKEIWVYEFENPFSGESEVYRLEFIDDRLIKWGK